MKLEQLEQFVKFLNSCLDPDTFSADTVLADELRKLVLQWRRAGSLAKLRTQDPQLYDAVYGVLVDHISPQVVAEDTAGGGAKINWGLRRPRYRVNSIVLFAELMLNPDLERLQGPCAAAGCGKFWIPPRWRRHNRFCSHDCACHFTAAQVYRRRQLQKVQRAVRALKQWAHSSTPLDWQDYVSRRTKIDKRFLTQALHRGDLTIPEKQRGSYAKH